MGYSDVVRVMLLRGADRDAARLVSKHFSFLGFMLEENDSIVRFIYGNSGVYSG